MRIFASFFYGFVVLLAASLFAHTVAIAPEIYEGYETFMYPQVILVVGIVFGSISFIQTLKSNLSLKGNQSVGTLLLSILAMAFLCLALVPLGFLIVSILFFICYSYILGYKKLHIIIPSAFVVSIFLWLVFEKALEIPLPLGVLELL